MRRLALPAALTLVCLLAGCATAAPRGDAVPMDDVVCGEAGLPAEGVVTGAVPAGFEPIAVQRCVEGQWQDEVGTWGGLRVEHLEGDLTELLAALAEPDDPPAIGPCTADMWLGPELWLSDAAGRAIRVPYPATGCGKPRPDVLERIEAALASLTVTEERFERGVLISSAAATGAGCATSADILVIDASALGELSSPSDPGGDGTALVPFSPPSLPDAAHVSGLRLCRYEVGGPSSNGPTFATQGAVTFVGAAEIGADAAREAVAQLRSAPVAGPCSQQPTMLVVAWPLPAASVSVTVELDGCRRLVGPDLVAREASPALLTLLQP